MTLEERVEVLEKEVAALKEQVVKLGEPKKLNFYFKTAEKETDIEELAQKVKEAMEKID